MKKSSSEERSNRIDDGVGSRENRLNLKRVNYGKMRSMEKKIRML